MPSERHNFEFTKMFSNQKDLKYCSVSKKSSRTLVSLIVQGKHAQAVSRCQTHPEEVSKFYQVDGAMNNLHFTMLHYMLCDMGSQAMGDDQYQLIKAMLEINPNLPSMTCKNNDDKQAAAVVPSSSSALHVHNQEVQNNVGFTPLHCLIYALFGGLSLVKQSKYLAKILSLMLKVDPHAATVSNQSGLLPLHIAITSCRHSRSLIREHPRRFKKSFKKMLDAHPNACLQRITCGRAAGCLPLHLLCMNAATFGEASHFAADLIFSEYPDAVSQRSDEDGVFPLHSLCTSLASSMPPVGVGENQQNHHRNAVDPDVFGLIMRSSPVGVIFGKDANGKSPIDILFDTGHFATATPYFLQMLRPHAILERLLMFR